MHGLVRCTHWVHVFTRVQGRCDNHRCHNKTPDRKWDGDVNDETPGSDGLRISEFEKKQHSELRFDARGRKSIFGARRGQTSSLRRGAARDGLRWKSQDRKKFWLCLLMWKNLKLEKVIKRFIPEPISYFSDSYVYEHLWTFSVSVWMCLFHVFVSWSYFWIYIYIYIYIYGSK